MNPISILKLHKPQIVGHWFLLVAPVIIVVDVLVASVGPIDRAVEAGLVFDLVALLPLLYIVCYRRSRKGALARALGLACLGIWICTKLVPPSDRVLLEYLEPLRYLGLAVLVLIELALIRLIVRSLRANRTVEDVSGQVREAAQMPAWVAKLVVWEVNLWRNVAKAARRLMGSRSDKP